MKHFRIWCQKVLPLVYDDSLSYYEVLCKVVDFINNLIDTDREIFEDIDALREELTIVHEWIDNFDDNAKAIMTEIIDKYIVTMVFFGLTDDGYFVAYIPESWEDVTFRTTELDIFTSLEREYGHLVLLY